MADFGLKDASPRVSPNELGQPELRHVIVTGGLGFIGVHLVNKLSDLGFSVIVIDDRSSASPLASTALSNSTYFLEMDLCDTNGVLAGVHDCVTGPVVGVFNLACPAAPEHYSKDPVQTLRVCAAGTWTALQVALEYDARFLLASTSEVYGDPMEHPQAETYRGNVSTIGPRAMYDEGKRFAETLTSVAAKQLGLDTTIARIFNTYGPGMRPDDGRLVPNFVLQSLKYESMTVYGDGEQTRSLTYVDDTVDGLIALWKSRDSGPINIGSEDERTILEIGQMIAEITAAGKTMKFEPLPGHDPRVRRPDANLASSVLGWRATTTLKDGLTRTVRYFSELRALQDNFDETLSL